MEGCGSLVCDQESADRFVAAAGDRLVRSEGIGYAHELGHNDYPFARQQYQLRQHGTTLAYIDVIVAAEFPVNDFDVNRLEGLLDCHGNVVVYFGPGVKTAGVSPMEAHSLRLERDLLEAKIIRKEAQMLPSYLKTLNAEPRWRRDHHARRIFDRYILQGWKIFMPDGKPLDSISAVHLGGAVRRWAFNHPSKVLASITAAPGVTVKPVTEASTVVPRTPASTSRSGCGANGCTLYCCANSTTSSDSSISPAPTISPAPSVTLACPSVSGWLEQLTDPIERKYTQSILNLLEELHRETIRDPSVPEAVMAEKYNPRVTDLVARAKLDLTTLLHSLQQCQEFISFFRNQSPEFRVAIMPLLLAEIKP